MLEAPKRPPRGFTLVELMIVLVIIGMLVAFILVVSMEGVRRGEERATQTLLTKLDSGMTDRIASLLTVGVSPTTAHQWMAQVPLPGRDVPSPRRAQVIAQYDMLRAELPDVFSFAPGTSYGATDYPIRFAGAPYTRADTTFPVAYDYVLPLGAQAAENGYPAIGSGAAGPGMGIHGASYTAAAGIYKNLGYSPAGYDGADNNGNGLIDEFGESGMTSDALVARRDSHQHKTARSEMLYALLVEGQGPLGSVFSADEFTDREVRDTDGDGLPEFVDAWGEPLQFYRWPILYRSNLQKGLSATPSTGPYLNIIEPREQNPLDPNQQLVAPSWWSSNPTSPTHANPLSARAIAFQTHFHLLVEPRARVAPTTLPNVTLWDRGSTYYERRAYFTKFLIVSSGPDRELGIGRWDVASTSLTPANLMLENQAAQAILTGASPRLDAVYQEPDSAIQTQEFLDAGLDDITNHNLLSTGGGSL